MHDPTTKEYVYAKAHGMWATSFLVGRDNEVRALKNVQDLYRAVFSEDPPLVPEAKLTDLIEEKLTLRTIKDFTRLLSMYDHSYPLLNLLLYEYELINLKIALSQLQQKKRRRFVYHRHWLLFAIKLECMAVAKRCDKK